ncbi:MAG: hypothetical protein AAF456_13040 [Planctomycetota bacterium]
MLPARFEAQIGWRQQSAFPPDSAVSLRSIHHTITLNQPVIAGSTAPLPAGNGRAFAIALMNFHPLPGKP